MTNGTHCPTMMPRDKIYFRRRHMKAKNNKRHNRLDREENEMLVSFEKGEWKTVKNGEKEKRRAQKMAVKTRMRAPT